MTLTDYWHELVTASLLGTDRRDPPDPPPGPLADVVADTAAPMASTRMLTAIGACTAVRRAGVRPRPPASPLAPPEPDGRPMISAAAARRWRSMVSTWPVLEDEWLEVVRQRGMQLSPDVLVGLLLRHRSDAGRRHRVMQLGGPVAVWLVEHRPELAAPPAARAGRPEPGSGVPALPVAPDLQPMLTATPDQVVAVVVDGLRAGRFAIAHRAVLVNLVARMRADACEPLAAALRAAIAGDHTGHVGLVQALADLAATRHATLEELS